MDKAQMHYELIRAGVNVPYTVILPAYDEERIRKLMEYSLALEGRARNVSVHAAGVVITNGNVDDYVPLYVSDKVEAEERRYADEEPDDFTERTVLLNKSKDEKQVVTQFDKDWIDKYSFRTVFLNN